MTEPPIPNTMPSNMIEMRVSRLMVDPFTDLPVLVLTDESGKHSVPVGIGVGEASAIASELENVALARPMTHDLLKTILVECGGSVQAVELRELRGDVMYATIILSVQGGNPVEVDSRPSDAIALSLRTGARIRVSQKVIEKSRHRDARKSRNLSLPRDVSDATGATGATSAIDQFDFLGDPESAAGAFTAPSDAWILEALRDEDFGKWKM